MSLIYKIINDVNGKIYVGKTEYSEDIRFKQHINDSKKDRCKNRPFYKSINKYGSEHFHIEKIEDCENGDIACKREIYWINKLRTYVGFKDCNGYNATLGGDSRKYKQYNIEEIINMYNETHNVHLISKKYDIDESYVRNLLNSHGVKLLHKKDLYKESDEHTVYQVELNSSKILNIFHSYSEIYDYLNKNSGAIGDAVRGRRNGSHYAYGFNWYRKPDYIEKYGNVSGF